LYLDVKEVMQSAVEGLYLDVKEVLQFAVEGLSGIEI
jgi:hypothetical protein